MTREEAIVFGKRILSLSLFDETHEFCELAVKALEQQPCDDWYDVPSDEMTLEQARQAVKDLRKKLAECLEQHHCSDVISRQAAIDAFGLSEKTRKYGGDHSGYETIMLYEVQDVIENLPPVTPQMKDEDVAKAFQFGLALGFGEKHDEMDAIMEAIKAVTPQAKMQEAEE